MDIPGNKKPRQLPGGVKEVLDLKEKAVYNPCCDKARSEYILAPSGLQPATLQGQMLDHLLNFDAEVLPTSEAPPPVAKASPADALNAKITTADWLAGMGVQDTDSIVSELEKAQARETFTALTTGAPIKDQHALVSTIETPAAVRHLTSMLTAYDWEFVNQAKELRGYAVAKILEECESPNANIRLKALGLLGKVTEIGLFTDKIEVKQAEMSDAEIEQRIKDKLSKFMGVIDVIDVAASTDDIPENGSSFTLAPDAVQEIQDEPPETDDADKA